MSYSLQKYQGHKDQKMEETLFQLKKKIKETCQLNIMCEPGLDPGPGGAIVIKDFIRTMDVN